MAMNAARLPRTPTLPHGEPIASYVTYLEAQKAVDHLSDKEFPVQHVTIVGADLRTVERITGRLTYSRVALGGLASGAWFGLAAGVLLSLFSTEGGVLPILPAVAIGAGFGILFAVISFALTGGQRDFTSASQIVATSYTVLCAAEHAGRARTLLLGEGGPGLGRAAAAPGAVPQPQVPQPQVPQAQVPQAQAPQAPQPPADPQA
jgi:hypothetical protein